MIYVECKPDRLLVNLLGISRRAIIHSGNISKVCKGLVKSENSKGLVDEDPSGDRPSYIDTLRLIQNQHEIKVLQDDKRENYLIVLCPRLEEWIIQATKEAHVDIRRYNLPDDGYQLHKVINFNLRKFEKLVNDLKEESKMIKALGDFIRE